MDGEPLDELYFKWLYEQVADPEFKNPALMYWKVLRILYTKKFVWVITALDDNRIKDGKTLRFEFLDQQGIPLPEVDENWLDLECSVLELMVGLSRRLCWISDGTPHYWFWVLMENIGLSRYNDKSRIPEETVDEALDALIYRNYESDGTGGFFPLRDPHEDQRRVEIWQQISAWVLEREILAG